MNRVYAYAYCCHFYIMASEADASCESDPNFAIICAFMEKFGELCGIGSIDFVELQNMLENNQEGNVNRVV